MDKQPTCFSSDEMDPGLRFPSLAYDGIEPFSNGITVGFHGALGAQPPVSSTKYPGPRVLATSTATFTTAHRRGGYSLRGCVSNAVRMSPRCLRKNSHCHMPAPAEGPAAPTLAPRACLKATACRHGRAFRIAEMQGSSRTSSPISISGRAFSTYGRFKLYIQFLAAMVCHLYICTAA